jgi:hypothetical protein
MALTRQELLRECQNRLHAVTILGEHDSVRNKHRPFLLSLHLSHIDGHLTCAERSCRDRPYRYIFEQQHLRRLGIDSSHADTAYAWSSRPCTHPRPNRSGLLCELIISTPSSSLSCMFAVTDGRRGNVTHEAPMTPRCLVECSTIRTAWLPRLRRFHARPWGNPHRSPYRAAS